MNIGVYEYVTIIIILYLLCPFFMRLLFSRRFPKLGWTERNILFLPTTAIVLLTFAGFNNVLAGHPIYFILAVGTLELATVFYPLKLFNLNCFAPKWLTIRSFDGNVKEVSRKKLFIPIERTSRLLLSYAESIPQGSRHTIDIVKLDSEVEKLCSSNRFYRLTIERDDGIYAAVWNGTAVQVKDIKL